MSPKPVRLGDLQLRIMKVLWERSEAGVAEVLEALNSSGEGHAFTTIATMLRKMEVRGLVTHRTEGRRFIYRPRVESARASREMAGDLLDRVFEGCLSDMVSHLLDGRKVSDEELTRLKRLIESKRKENGQRRLF